MMIDFFMLDFVSCRRNITFIINILEIKFKQEFLVELEISNTMNLFKNKEMFGEWRLELWLD